MRNWMMLALDAKLRAEANDEGADDGGFGAAFNEGIGEEADTGGTREANQGGDTDDNGGDDDAGGDSGDGEGAEGGDGDTGAESGKTAEKTPEGDGKTPESGNTGGGTDPAKQDTGGAVPQGGAPAQGTQGQAPAGGQPQQPAAVKGDGGVPADQNTGQQQLDPATLEAIFKAMGGNRGQQQGQPQGQQGGQQQQPQGQQPQGEQQKQPPKDWTEYLTPEEKAALDKYGKDWNEVSEPERIRTQAMMRHQEQQILSQVERALAPIAEHIQKSQVQSHFGQIREAHEDFDQLRETGELAQWAQTLQNPMLRTQAQHVLQQGSTEEVIGLIDLYKQWNVQGQQQNTGQTTGAAQDVPASSQAPANGGTPQVTQQQGQTKPPKPAVDPKAAAATAAVKSGSRGGDPRGADKNDFMAGFEATASEPN